MKSTSAVVAAEEWFSSLRFRLIARVVGLHELLNLAARIRGQGLDPLIASSGCLDAIREMAVERMRLASLAVNPKPSRSALHH